MKQFGLSSSRLLLMGSIIAFITVLDQLSKAWIVQHFERGEVLPVIPNFFNLILTYNRGAAFGMFSNLPEGSRQLVLGVTSFAALGLVLYFLFRDYKGLLPAQVALSLVLGGAIGNLIDRVVLGEVVDFLDFYIGAYHWPAFNVADSSIFIGVFILLFLKPQPKTEEQPQ
jgi:signal peptidase II